MTTGHALGCCLATHAWVAQAHGDAMGMLVWLNQTGYTALQQCGRASLLMQLQDHLSMQSLETPAQWRLLDAGLDATDPHTISQLLQAPRPSQVEPNNECVKNGLWTLSLRLPPDLVQFDNHFRQTPIFPGVMQVGLALALAAPRLGTSKYCRDMEALKFQRLLRPGDDLQLRLWFEEAPDTERGKLHFTYTMGTTHCSSGRLRVSRE